MEFVKYDAIRDLLSDMGVSEVSESEDQLRFSMHDGGDVVHLHITSGSSTVDPREGARVAQVPPERLAEAFEEVLTELHLAEVLLVPIGKWRRVFDAVAFSLADHEEWQEMDAAATVELNTRDPLVCGPGDFQTLGALVKALLSDADSLDQGFTVFATATPVLMEIVTDGAIRVSLGNQVLADEVAGVLA